MGNEKKCIRLQPFDHCIPITNFEQWLQTFAPYKSVTSVSDIEGFRLNFVHLYCLRSLAISLWMEVKDICDVNQHRYTPRTYGSIEGCEA